MNRIDVHNHMVPVFYRDAMRAAGHVTTSGADPEWTPEIALRTMDAHGIATAITSISYPGTHFGDDARARALARRCNELAAELARRWPGRFGGFATVPLPDIPGAVDEVAYALDSLHLDGVVLLGSTAGRFLGDPALEPLMAALDARDAVVFIHPGMHPSSRTLGMSLPGFMMEFLFDTSRAAANLLFSRTLERFPRIRFVLAHAGGILPYIGWRLSVAPMISTSMEGWTDETILAGLRRFWYDTALSPSRQTMGALMQVADPSRIVFGSDWPYAPEGVTAKSIAALNQPDFLDPRRLAAIERGNALALFPRLGA